LELPTAPITIAPYVALDKVNVVINRDYVFESRRYYRYCNSCGTASNLEYTLVTLMQVMAPRVLYIQVKPTTGIFTNLPVADYLITVRNLDNCDKGVHYKRTKYV
jgi:hypothetical protein